MPALPEPADSAFSKRFRAAVQKIWGSGAKRFTAETIRTLWGWLMALPRSKAAMGRSALAKARQEELKVELLEIKVGNLVARGTVSEEKREKLRSEAERRQGEEGLRILAALKDQGYTLQEIRLLDGGTEIKIIPPPAAQKRKPSTAKPNGKQDGRPRKGKR